MLNIVPTGVVATLQANRDTTVSASASGSSSVSASASNSASASASASASSTTPSTTTTAVFTATQASLYITDIDLSSYSIDSANLSAVAARYKQPFAVDLLGSVMAASKPLVFTVTALPAIGALYSAARLISEVCMRSLSYFDWRCLCHLLCLILIDCGLRLIAFLSHLVSS